MAETVTTTGFEQQDDGVFPPLASDTYASQLIWLAITFGLLYYLMKNVALPRISSILEVRQDRIAADLDEANRLRDESDAAVAAYEQRLAEARSSAQGTAATARDEAKARSDAKRAAEEARLNAHIAESEERIAAVRAEAMSEVESIATDTAEALVERLVPTKVSRAEIAAAVAQARS